jgi:hypothetical protein
MKQRTAPGQNYSSDHLHQQRIKQQCSSSFDMQGIIAKPMGFYIDVLIPSSSVMARSAARSFGTFCKRQDIRATIATASLEF